VAPPRLVVQRREEFVEALQETQKLLADGASFTRSGNAWDGARWKLYALAEMLAVRTYSAWETFSHDLLILTLATNTSELAKTTELTIWPQRVSLDMAEALLTSTRYLEFRDVSDLRGRAKKWLVCSPFEAMHKGDIDAADDLRVLRNFVVHRSRQSEQAYRKLLPRRGVPVAHGAPLPGEFLCAGSPSRLDGYLTTLVGAGARLVP
jgi:hypothetical protein